MTNTTEIKTAVAKINAQIAALGTEIYEKASDTTVAEELKRCEAIEALSRQEEEAAHTKEGLESKVEALKAAALHEETMRCYYTGLFNSYNFKFGISEPVTGRLEYTHDAVARVLFYELHDAIREYNDIAGKKVFDYDILEEEIQAAAVQRAEVLRQLNGVDTDTGKIPPLLSDLGRTRVCDKLGID